MSDGQLNFKNSSGLLHCSLSGSTVPLSDPDSSPVEHAGVLEMTGDLNNGLYNTCYLKSARLLPVDISTDLSTTAVECNLKESNHFHINAGSQITSIDLQNPYPGQSGHIILRNTSDLTHNVIWGASVKWQGAASPNLSSTSDSIDIISYYVLSTDEILLSASINHSATAVGYTLDNVDINSGAIDGTIIGANSATTASFSGLTVSGDTLPSVDNTYDIGSANYRIQNLYVNQLVASSLSGTPTAPTAVSSTNTTQIATTAFVQDVITNLIDSAPDGLNTLNELAAALNDDTNYATSITTSLATKAPLASPDLTGTPVAPTATDSTNNTQIATTAYVDSHPILSKFTYSSSNEGTFRLLGTGTNSSLALGGGTDGTLSYGVLYASEFRRHDSNGIKLGSVMMMYDGELRLSARNNHKIYFKFIDGTDGSEVSKGYVENDGSNTQLNFTGQHRNYEDDSTFDLNPYVGYIVQSTGIIDSIDINEALPRVKLTNTINCKSVYGVISSREEKTTETKRNFGNFVSVNTKEEKDSRLVINSVGEGGIWVCNAAGSIENGDYITSCLLHGLGIKQNDDVLHNYTVAKATMDCDFQPQLIPKKTLVGFDDIGRPLYEYDNNLSVPEYEIKYLAPDGTQTSQENSQFTIAFIACTYHCG
jgi:hypothetical protein